MVDREPSNIKIPELARDDVNRLFKIIDESRSRLLTIAEAEGMGILSNWTLGGLIEVTGMPHLGKTTMLKRLQKDCAERGRKVEIVSENSTITKSPDRLDNSLSLYNLGILFNAAGAIFGKSPNPYQNHPIILDRGFLGQIAFIDALQRNGDMGTDEAEASKKFIVSVFGGWIDTLVICNADPQTNLAPPHDTQFDRTFMTRLSEAYKRLPITICKIRNDLKDAQSTLTVVELNADSGWSKFRYEFFRSLGTAINSDPQF